MRLESILGAWTSRQDSSRSVLVTEEQISFAHMGELDYVSRISAVTARGLSSVCFGRTVEIDVRLEPESLWLSLEAGEQPESFQRGSSAAFEPAPLPLPAPTPIDSARIGAIQRELALRAEADRRSRTEAADEEELLTLDTQNERMVRQLVEEVGWVDRRRFGAEASFQAWLLVQHARSLPLQLAVLQALDREDDGTRYALLYDRTQMRLARPQSYGSQLIQESDGTLTVYQLSDPSNVDARRADVGLEPLTEYLNLFSSDPAAG